jgi:hypothetical protein
MRQSSSQRIFSMEWIQARVKPLTASTAPAAPAARQRLIVGALRRIGD